MVTGHTASDQAETVLYRLAAAPGRRALMGMPARRGRIVRPLLEVTRDQTAAYCRSRGLSFCEDPSNESSRYARGRVRGQLLAALRAVHPGAEANLAASARLLREEGEVLDGLVDTILEGRDELAADELARLPVGLGRLVLARLADVAVGTPVPGAGRRLERVLALAQRGGTVELDLGSGARAVIAYGRVRVAGPGAPPPETSAAGRVALTIPGQARLGRWRLSCRVAPAADVDPARWVAQAGEGARGVLDADLLRAGPVVRPWRPGDRMRPLGVSGSRAVADLLGEHRVPREERASTPLLECEGHLPAAPAHAAQRARSAARGTPRRLTRRDARRRA